VIEVRGFCPSIHQPMRERDGLLVRIQLPTGEITTDQAHLIADAAESIGCETLELTNRANLQLRGLDEAGSAILRDRLIEAGLAQTDPAAEAVRGVLVNPTAGLDPTELLDLRPLARALDRLLTDTPALHHLPAKLGFRLDGGGRFALGMRPAAFGLVAESDTVLRLWLGEQPTDLLCRPGEAVAMAARLLERYLAITETDAVRRRPGAVADELLETLNRHPRFRGDDEGKTLRPGSHVQRPISETGLLYIAATVPAGRLTPVTLRTIGDIAQSFGSGVVRLSPWRLILLPDIRPSDGADVAAGLALHGLATRADDPWAGLVPCVGRRGCAASATDTLADAAVLARRLAGLLDHPLHLDISGCAKGCARRGPADAALIGTENGMYEMRIGGDIVGEFPADAAVDQLVRLAQDFAADRPIAESFAGYYRRIGAIHG